MLKRFWHVCGGLLKVKSLRGHVGSEVPSNSKLEAKKHGEANSHEVHEASSCRHDQILAVSYTLNPKDTP